MVLFILINEQPRILTSGQYYCRSLTGGTICVCAKTVPPGGPPITRGDQPCIHRWSYGDIQCIDADGPPDHACVRRWSPRTTFEWDQILHDSPNICRRQRRALVPFCLSHALLCEKGVTEFLAKRHWVYKEQERHCTALIFMLSCKQIRTFLHFCY